MIKIITRVLITALALILVAKLIPGITVVGLYPAIIAALLLGVLNLVVKPILIILTLPITIVTLGLFMFVINASLFTFVASFVEGFSVSGFWVALLGSLIVSIISAIGNKFVSNEKVH
ncbi:MAG: putative membrane protein [Acidimicrobiales bacterium]|jgi:putative membrane protein